MDYLKSVVPSQLVSERGSNLVVINPGSANVRIGLAKQDTPFSVPHCIARRTSQVGKPNVQDQMLNTQVTTSQHVEREKAYNTVASLLKIPFLDENASFGSAPRKMARIDGYNQPTTRKDVAYTWANVYEDDLCSPTTSATVADESETSELMVESDVTDSKDTRESKRKYRETIFGEEAMRIAPTEPYCIRRPIRRGHFNVSQHYPAQQVYEDLIAIWDWILRDKMHIAQSDRNLYSAVLVVPGTFGSREIKEMLTIVLQDLRFSSAVVHQEGLAAVFGNGLSTACIVNMGAQTTTVVCIEDGVSLPHTEKILSFGGEDICRCLLWIQKHYQSWPKICTDVLTKPIDMLMLNRLKESYCDIKEGELEMTATVHSYEGDMPPVPHKTKLTSLNVPPMGLFYPNLLVPEAFPPPPETWFQDHENMLEETWNMDFPGGNMGLSVWDTFTVSPPNPKKEEKIGLAKAITSSILSAGRIDLQRKLFSSIQLVGGVGLTAGLVPAMEERVLHAIPPTEAIDTVEVLQSRMDPIFVSWKGGAILGILDFGREAWIHREDWIRNGIHVGSGRKYKDSYYLMAQAMCFINS
ncbi:PREDICTED: actin-related protein 9 [Tarenaya hassleriana]|uniref:actin-related protein 9 n=1 Tax=Tarenaya hassleriana TaxID=28532 RepID=UPI00053C7497|nr:PREDICTED: actin-related protein 9 [Tarenaya hassleriana]XP_010542932.1 PREDICTED: actin-related protein 9 [Tarenaya hassleriana]